MAAAALSRSADSSTMTTTRPPRGPPRRGPRHGDPQTSACSSSWGQGQCWGPPNWGHTPLLSPPTMATPPYLWCSQEGDRSDLRVGTQGLAQPRGSGQDVEDPGGQHCPLPAQFPQQQQWRGSGRRGQYQGCVPCGDTPTVAGTPQNDAGKPQNATETPQRHPRGTFGSPPRPGSPLVPWISPFFPGSLVVPKVPKPSPRSPTTAHPWRGVGPVSRAALTASRDLPGPRPPPLWGTRGGSGGTGKAQWTLWGQWPLTQWGPALQARGPKLGPPCGHLKQPQP